MSGHHPSWLRHPSWQGETRESGAGKLGDRRERRDDVLFEHVPEFPEVAQASGHRETHLRHVIDGGGEGVEALAVPFGERHAVLVVADEAPRARQVHGDGALERDGIARLIEQPGQLSDGRPVDDDLVGRGIPTRRGRDRADGHIRAVGGGRRGARRLGRTRAGRGTRRRATRGRRTRRRRRVIRGRRTRRGRRIVPTGGTGTAGRCGAGLIGGRHRHSLLPNITGYHN